MTLRRALLVLVGLAACTRADDSVLPILTDSLGVTLVEYPTSFGSTTDRTWAAEPEPLFSIGESSAELFRIRTVVFQSNGGIVVANGGSHELILFDPARRLQTRTGGEGGGPGEFRQLTFLSVGAADSLFAYDAREHRLSVFDPSGVYVRSVTLQGLDPFGTAELVAVSTNGEIVGAFHQRTSGPGLVRDSIVVAMFDWSGQLASSLGVYPHFYTHWGPHTDPHGGGTSVFPLPVVLSGITAVGVGNAAIFVGVPNPYELIRIGRSGERRITRTRASPDLLTEVHRDRMFTALGRSMDPQELTMLRELTGPIAFPAFGSDPLTARVGEPTLLVTDAGGVWLRPFSFPDDSGSVGWPRFDADGFYEGTTVVSSHFRPTAVRGDVVLGVYRDTTDVEYVRAYRLVADR